MKLRNLFFLIIGSILSLGCVDNQPKGPVYTDTVKPTVKKSKTTDFSKVKSALIPYHEKLGKPKPGEWLYSHKESGQTFAQYVRSKPVRPNTKRNIIYLQPIGNFTAKQQKIINLTAEYIAIYYGVEVKTLKTNTLKNTPAYAKRTHPQWGDKQILSTYLLYKVLKPSLKKDGVALLGLTSSDLWPGRGWNFVFGQASLRDRVGIWSIYRNGDPDKEFTICLERTLKTAVHELGHMFSMYHCTAYECNMCGSNSRTEADSRTIAACPECLCKICWCTGIDPIDRYKKLIKFYKANKLKKELKACEKYLKVLETAK